VTRNKRANVTRNRRTDRFTVEKLAQDGLDVRFLRRMGFFADGWITIGATLKWPRIARMRIARYVMTPALLLVSCFIIGSGMALFGPAWQNPCPYRDRDSASALVGGRERARRRGRFCLSYGLRESPFVSQPFPRLSELAGFQVHGDAISNCARA
jgi:hypothetical protein